MMGRCTASSPPHGPPLSSSPILTIIPPHHRYPKPQCQHPRIPTAYTRPPTMSYPLRHAATTLGFTHPRPRASADLNSTGLTDVEAPPPVSEHPDPHRDLLENRGSITSTQGAIGITEAEAPAPVATEDDASAEDAALQALRALRRRPTLEDRASVVSPLSERELHMRYSTPEGEVVTIGYRPSLGREEGGEGGGEEKLRGRGFGMVADRSAHHVKMSAWLTFFSIWGTLGRLGLSALTHYNGAPLGGVIWANFAGCLIMGVLLQDKKLFAFLQAVDGEEVEIENEKDVIAEAKKTLPLYVGLTTGFCGSLTSFSSFLLECFKQLANVAPTYDGRPTKGYNLMALLAYLISTLALSFSALQLGAHIAIFAHRFTPTLPRRAVTLLDWSVLPAAVSCWIAAVLMAVFIERWRADALFACVFAPLGVYGRYWVSRWLNPRVASFPLGTFVVNVAGTAVLAAVTAGRSGGDGGAGCGVLRGVADGFCGCLTTVSTFVVEAAGLRGEWSPDADVGAGVG
ncbi:hypothetical protein EX30DRAFT_55385 [Ascodesmis nigricans]|uniref:Uncharacterized protein n=1 Tax=Ascodesmis nigricans TaxID=341454 RepID=A0A4S2MVR7_9PEZI|nr:hypothetical protein EX30DRAFT_55385 [Ascodesmis nigricans]